MKNFNYSITSKNYYNDYYTNTYSSVDSQKVNKRDVEKIINQLKSIPITFSKKQKVLDVACGVSILGKTFSTNVYGFDLNKKAVEIAKKNRIHATVGNIELKWKYPNNFFDIVIASHIIEHVSNPDHLLSEAKRVLKPNGLLLVITPNLAAWFNRILLLFGFQPFFTEVSTLDKTLGLKQFYQAHMMHEPVGHLRIFTLKALHDICNLHKYKIIKTGGTEFGSFPQAIEKIDQIFSRAPSLASCIFIIAKKS